MMEDNGDILELGQAEGDGTTAQMLELFGGLITLQREKARTYGEAFRSQGYMGNVARVLSKAARLKMMMWRDLSLEDSRESVTDTLEDLINIAAFALINYRDGNKWGND